MGEPNAYSVPALSEEEYAVASELGRFSEVVLSAAEKYEPSLITRYALDLAGAYNKFYINRKIAADDLNERNFRLSLTKAVKITLTNALSLLGIQTVEQM